MAERENEQVIEIKDKETGLEISNMGIPHYV